ncbi:uncharacterized protein EV422DRAFT_564435 [Fimicolochytrium jonesii]|uniref:uncharacterized protein n=1 Tax=Fimicolochytrium jonesii TaxID=1396493 RepID=UPI0022FE1EC9|nr:uncharacterized protein EV422DRAFT_564435 [Fimicolochytrium jonesii]KAI8825088.1 hypothetical protein EV422DRAFT_564435 [Fimicolochytrium jonesii]
MGNCASGCLDATEACCPNSAWLASYRNGLASQLTFDYDEIDDLEFENLLNNPNAHGAYNHAHNRSPFWDKVAALFRPPRDGAPGRPHRGGFRAGGYQSVPTDGREGNRGPFVRELDDEEFLRHEEDAQLMNNEQIRRITSFVREQPRATNPSPTPPPLVETASKTPDSIGSSDPLSHFSKGVIESEPLPSKINIPKATPLSNSPEPSSVPKPAHNTHPTFRPKKRSTFASGAAFAAAALSNSGQSPPSVSLDSESDFGNFQTAKPEAPKVSSAFLPRQESDFDVGASQGYATPPEALPQQSDGDSTSTALRTDPLGGAVVE